MPTRVLQHRLADGAMLHVECYGEFKGAREVIVMIPGWAYTAAVFEQNIALLARDYDVLTFDPRGHGRSSPCTAGHSYAQHGQDLQHLLTSLNIPPCILLGWSLGVYGALNYIEQYGESRVTALIAVDESPQIIQRDVEDWGEGSAEEVAALITTVRSGDYLAFFADYMAAGYVNSVPQALLDQYQAFAATLRQEDAAALLHDATRYDFSALYARLDQRIPILQIVREDWAPQAQQWCALHTPHSRVSVLGGHLMLREFPDDFNQRILQFLAAR